jgi:hypothetical protein
MDRRKSRLLSQRGKDGRTGISWDSIEDWEIGWMWLELMIKNFEYCQGYQIEGTLITTLFSTSVHGPKTAIVMPQELHLKSLAFQFVL